MKNNIKIHENMRTLFKSMAEMRHRFLSILKTCVFNIDRVLLIGIIIIFIESYICISFEYSIGISLLYSFIYSSFLSILSVIKVFNLKIYKIVFYSLITANSLAFLIEFFVNYQHGIRLNEIVIISLLLTNSREIYEYIGNIPAEAYMIFAGLGLLSGIFIKAILRYARFCLILAKIIVVCGFLITTVLVGGAFVNRSKTVAWFNHFSMPRLVTSSYYAFCNMSSYSSANHSATIMTNNSSISNIVLILGESLTKNHMSLYGYTNDTTPLLKERDDLFVFGNVISSFCGTNPSIENMFTFRNYENNMRWNESENLISIMKKSGYHTLWISNQEKVDRWGSAAYVLSCESDEALFSDDFATPGTRKGRYDERVISLLGELPCTGMHKQKNFYVIHLLGSHEIFRERYPDGYECFSASDIKMNISDEKKDIVASYDNSVLYNDYVVNSIIDYFQNTDCLMIYISDHGEELYGETDKVTHANTKDGLEIPFIIWTSKDFVAKHEKMYSRLKNVDKNRKYMTDDLIHTILDLAEIYSKDYDSKRSLLNDKFDVNRKRIILRDYREPVNFDEIYRGKM